MTLPINVVGVTTSLAQQVLVNALVRPTARRSIGTLLPQVVVSEKHTDELQMTDHPVEAGATITDHAFKLPAIVVITCGFGKAGPPSDQPFAIRTPVDLNDVYQSLLKLQDPPTLIDIVTGKRLYKNMLVKVISVETDVETENVLMITLTCRQVIMATTQDIVVPAPASAQAEPQTTQAPTNTGAKQLLAPATLSQYSGSNS